MQGMSGNPCFFHLFTLKNTLEKHHAAGFLIAAWCNLLLDCTSRVQNPNKPWAGRVGVRRSLQSIEDTSPEQFALRRGQPKSY